MRRLWIIAAAGYVLLLLSVDLPGFPGLHGDEAWFGLEALRIGDSGLTSANGMNPYTGSLFPWLVAQVFQFLPPGVSVLRLPGILLNTAAFSILLLAVEWSAGSRRALLLFLLVGSSLLFLWLSRIAWEVTAFQPFILAAALAIVLAAERRGRWTAPHVALFLLANELGVINHLIFSAVPISFFGASLLAAAGRRDEKAIERTWVGALAVGSMLLVLAVKWAVPDAVFARWSGTIVVVLLALPVALARWANAWPAPLPGWIERIRPGWLLLPLLTGLVAFVALHGIAFVGTLANVLVMKRVASWAPSLPGTLLGYAWGLTITCVLAAGAWRTLRRVRRREALDTADFVMLWALGCAVSLAILTGRQSLRHYVLLNCLVLVAVALSPALRRPLWRPFILAAALAFIGTNLVAWRGIMERTNQPPLRFRMGYGYETSAHFLRLDDAVRDLERLGVCHTEADVFIELPLEFYRATRPHECSSERVYRASYCRDCPPSFVSFEPIDRRSPLSEEKEDRDGEH